MSKGWHFMAIDVAPDQYVAGPYGPLVPDSDVPWIDAVAIDLEAGALLAKHAAFHEFLEGGSA